MSKQKKRCIGCEAIYLGRDGQKYCDQDCYMDNFLRKKKEDLRPKTSIWDWLPLIITIAILCMFLIGFYKGI